MTLAEKLRDYRGVAGLSAIKAARFCGVNKSTYSRWEAGLVAPSFDNRLRLAELFGIPVSSLQSDKEKEAGPAKNPASTVAA